MDVSELAEHIGELLVRHGCGGGWVIASAHDGKLVVIDAAAQASFEITVAAVVRR